MRDSRRHADDALDAAEVDRWAPMQSPPQGMPQRLGFLRSIRWQMQAWHAVVLLAVVTAFGGALYFELRRARFEEIDAELESGVEYLALWLRGPKHEPPKGPPGGRLRRPGEGPPRFFDEREANAGRPPQFSGRHEREADSERARRDDQAPGKRAGFHSPGPRMPHDQFLIDNLELPEGLVRRFPASPPYFAVWRSQGTLLASSDVVAGAAADDLGQAVPAAYQTAGIQQRGELREVIRQGPRGYRILVGRSVAKERAELARLLWLLAATGAGVLAVGLVGDYLISRRVVRPIARISRTAAAISADNLSQRIDVTGMESELRGLAQTINGAFARIEAAFEQQVRFTADASHELRTPLSILSSNAELALRKDRTAEEYRSFLQTCYQTSKRMQSLVETLLTLARYDSRAIVLEKRPASLRRLVDDCLELVAPLGAEKQLRFRVDAPDCQVCVDSVRLSQVLVNLLVNAIAYNYEAGEVALSARCSAGELTFCIEDTGRGIPTDEQGHVFERFYRVDKARSRATGGYGLGLAICKSIIEAHGGEITLASEPGKGTTFLIRLPVDERPRLNGPQAKAGPEGRPKLPAANGNGRSD